MLNSLVCERHRREAITRSMQHLTRDQQEIEWQFDALDVRPVVRWLENGVGEDPVIVPGETCEISDTYLDTEHWRIYQAG